MGGVGFGIGIGSQGWKPKSSDVVEADFYDEFDALVISDLSILPNDIMWFKPYLASDYPELTCDKKYIFIYCTDHDPSSGEIWWGKGDNLDLSDFVEQGVIVQEYQSESPELIRIPAAECGDSEVIHLYYHTDNDDPVNAGLQQTKLITTTGGVLHTATWTQKGSVLGIVGDENHTGYLKVTKLGVSNYKGVSLTHGGLPQGYSFSTSTNGRTWSRENMVKRTVFAPDGYQYKMTTGDFILDKYGYNWWMGNIVPLDFVGSTYFVLIKTDANLQPIEFCDYLNSGIGKTIVGNKVFGDIEVYIEGNTANVYWKETNKIVYAKYDIRNLAQYTDVPNISYSTDNILTYYKFEDNLTDEKAAYTPTGTAITYEAALIGKSAKLNGTTSKIDMNTNIVGGRSAFSISCLVKLNGDVETPIYANWASPYCILLRQVSGYFQCNMFIGGAQYGGAFVIQADTTTDYLHLVFTFDGTTMKMYVDTVKAATEYTAVGTINTGAGTEKIGNWGSKYGDMNIDCFAIWDKALDYSEISATYDKLKIDLLDLI